MSNDTLLRKLKGSVNMENPQKLGVMLMGNPVTVSSESAVISTLSFSKEVTLKASGGQFVTPYNQSSPIGYTNTIIANSEQTIETQMDEIVTIEIPEKYSLLVNKSGAAHVWNVEDVKYSSGLVEIYAQGNSCEGDYTKIANLLSLSIFRMNYSTFPIDALIFADSSTFTALQTLDLTGCTAVANKSDETKALIEAAHPGITVTW